MPVTKLPDKRGFILYLFILHTAFTTPFLLCKVWDVITCVRSAAVSTPALETMLGHLAASATCCLEKIWRDSKVIESVSVKIEAVLYCLY